MFSRYVSCSECSYDSDNCTCNSADRCYCSLGGDDINAKLKAEERRRTDSRQSCDDKCYCSLGETVGDGSTTFCDTDSCASASKCYCSPERKLAMQQTALNTNINKKGKRGSFSSDNLALDYELFTVSGNGRHVKPTEALSVKKSVEMAAVFADVKLSQSTDITNLKPSREKHMQKPKHHHKKHHEPPPLPTTKPKVLMNNINNMKHGVNANDDYIFKSGMSSELILRKEIELSAKRITKSESYYQAIAPRPVSASLEDSLGYLP